MGEAKINNDIAILVNATVLSAGITAAISAYLLQSKYYKKYAKFIGISFIFFCASCILCLYHIAFRFALIAFIAGWGIIITSLVFATLSIEIVGLRASLHHAIIWVIRYKILAFLFRKKRLAKDFPKKEVKFNFLEGIIEGNLTRGTSFLIIGNTESFPHYFAYEILWEGLRRGENVIYVSTDQIPYNIRETMNLPSEMNKHFFLIDCYTPTFGLGEIPITGTKEKYSAKSVKGLHQCIRSIRAKIGLTKDYYTTRIVYDNLEQFGETVGYDRLIKYLLHSIPTEIAIGWISTFVTYFSNNNTKIFKLLRNAVDCILTLKMKKETDKLVRYVDFIKLQNLRFPIESLPYYVLPYDIDITTTTLKEIDKTDQKFISLVKP